MNDPLPPEIRRFIAQQIESVAQLEALLLLRREPRRSWTAEELARAMYLAEKTCGAMLGELERRRYVVREPGANSFRFEPVEREVDAIVDRLGKLYVDRRVAVISEIYSNPLSKVQTFADAFRFRKDEPS